MEDARYSITARTHEQPVAPARFSVKLGQPGGVSVDVPFCPTVPPNAQISYTGFGSTGRSCLPGPIYAKSAPVGSFPGLTDDVADLPIIDVAAASTAVLGSLHLYEPAVGIVDATSAVRLGAWASLARQGKAFARGKECVDEVREAQQMTQERLDKFADAGVFGFVDGGLIDNGAVGHALVAGAREIVLFVYNQDTKSKTPHPEAPEDFAGMFKNGPRSISIGKLPIYARSWLFDMDNEAMKEQYRTFPQMDAPDGAEHLFGITLGTFKNLTTLDLPLWGVRSGIEVTLHVVSINIARQTPFDSLAQDVVNTILSPTNQELLHSVLLDRMLMPKHRA